MLGQRRRRWANIEPAMAQGLVFAGSVGLPVAVHLHVKKHNTEYI